jgi:hypothetical protein
MSNASRRAISWAALTFATAGAVGHDLFVSRGYVDENLVVANTALDPARAVQGSATSFAIVLPAARPGPQDLYRGGLVHKSARSANSGNPASGEDRALLKAVLRKEGVVVQVLCAPAALPIIGNRALAGSSAQMDDLAFVRELPDWMRLIPSPAIETVAMPISLGRPVSGCCYDVLHREAAL